MSGEVPPGSPGPQGSPGPSGGLVVVGDVVTDVVALHRGPLAPHTDTAARIRVLPGGAGANAAAWAAWSLVDAGTTGRAGGGTAAGEVRLLGRVGADSAGWHREALEAAGVRTRLTVDPQLPTAVVIALVDEDAERTFLTDSGACAALGPQDWDESLLDGAARLHLSGYLYFSDPGRRLAALATAAAHRRGLPVSADPASTGFIERLGADAFRRALGDRIGLLLPNLAEARLLSGRQDPVEAAERLSAEYGEAVVKLGPAGALAARDGRLLAKVPAVPVTPVDTTGAGDAFTGGYLAAALTGADPATAAEAGCRTGAHATTLLGGRPPRSGPAPAGS
ncbi:carbohydrate kinase family protein [Kitasatospora camelliae]|uniref:PfkB family carbohydrate kinase n=1 Tax=Kitasatospora camelliae TaxID=3156397 RepID=A0AAU8K2C3_9ACTN